MLEKNEQIYETSSYDKFKKIPTNRKLYRKHVDYIKSLISDKNRLHEFPIIVTKNFEVIDGQHRLQAAKELCLPVFYKIGKNLVEEDIITYNSTSKVWSMEDYFNYWILKEKEVYLKLREFMDKYNITIGPAIKILGLGNNAEFPMHFKKGTFRIKDFEACCQIMEKARTIIGLLHQKLEFKQRTFTKNATFIRSLFNFLSNDEVDLETFLKKINIRITSFHQCATQHQYYKLFENIYNYRNQNPIKIFEEKE